MFSFSPIITNSSYAGLPLTTWLIITWFCLAAIHTHNKDLWQAERTGQLPEGDGTPPDFLAFLIVPQYATLIAIVLADGSFSRAAIVWGATFLISVVARSLLFFSGAILLIPFALLTASSRRKG